MRWSLSFLFLAVACQNTNGPASMEGTLVDSDCTGTDCGSTGGTIHDLDGDGFDDDAFGGSDCDDSDDAIHPDAIEVCDLIDNNCDGLVDEDDPNLDTSTLIDWYRDGDGDGYGDSGGNVQKACLAPSGAVEDNTDCNDDNIDVNPGAIEVPGDCVDNDCDGVIGDMDCSGLLYMVRESDDMVRKLDPVTLLFTDVGPLNVPFEFGELAWDMNLGVMYMVDGYPGTNLYTVDVGTGQATLVGNHGAIKVFGLAVDSSGTLYGANGSDGGLWTIDSVTANTSFIGSSTAATGLTWDTSRDILVGIKGNGDISEFDVQTAASTLLGNVGAVGDGGLAHDIDNDLYWMVDHNGDLYTFDPNNNYASTLILSNLGAHDGLTFGP